MANLCLAPKARRGAPWAALFSCVVPFIAGCVDNNVSVYVESVLAPVAPACEVKADHNSPTLLSGSMDLVFTRSYQAVLLVGNQMAPRGKKAQLRAETMGVELRGAEVRLTSPGGDIPAPNDKFSIPVGGFVISNNSETPGYGLAAVTLIPSSVADALAADLAGSRGSRTIVANVRVFGTTLGGIDITSAEFNFPIQVCSGCSIAFPTEAMEGGQCVLLADPPADDACSPGQDSTIDCRNCAKLYSECVNP